MITFIKRIKQTVLPDKAYTLSVIMNRIKQLFDERMNEVYFWMKVELMHVKTDRNGHYYLDIVETEEGKVIARSSAQIWNYTAVYLRETLGNDFDAVIKHGSEIMCYCKVVFHTIYGLSFIVTKVDLNYNLGALEQRERATIEHLKKEGLLETNKKHYLPKVLQRIALVASPNTSGFEDFMKQLYQNSFGFDFYVETFAVKVQGDLAVTEIVNQLQQIPNAGFDAVVLLRGGGSKFDLEPFNALELAKAIAFCPLPVLTGIGHETDTSVADLTAHTSLKTPSAVGAFIVERTAGFTHNIHLLYDGIKRIYDQKMLQLNKDLKHQITEFASLSKSKTRIQRGELHTLTHRILTTVNEAQARSHSLLNVAVQQLLLLPNKQLAHERTKAKEHTEQLHLYSKYLVRDAKEPLQLKTEQLVFLTKMKLKLQRQKMEEWEYYPKLYHPNAVLQKGYALVKKNGKIITDQTDLKENDLIEIELYNRIFNATINNSPQWKNLPTKKQNEN